MATSLKLSTVFKKLHLPSKPNPSLSSSTSTNNTTPPNQTQQQQQQQQQSQQPQQPRAPPSRLETLPPELLLKIASDLHPVDHICLSLTCHYFSSSLPKRTFASPTAHRCIAWLMTCRLEREQTLDSPSATASCCWCKRPRPITDFTGQHSTHNLTKLLKPIWFDPDRMDEVPEQRACGFHEPSTQWVPRPHCTCMGKGRKRYWIRWLDVTCMHCGEMIGWEDERETGCDECECEICPRLRMPCFERYGPKRGARWTGKIPSIRRFFRNEEGELRIVEKGAWRSFDCADVYSHATEVGNVGVPTGASAEAGDQDEADDSDEPEDDTVEAPSDLQSKPSQ